MVKLTFEEAREGLLELAAERPDYVYEPVSTFHGGVPTKKCLYLTPAGEPSCIVGHLLSRKGMDRHWLAAADEAGASAGVLHRYGVDADSTTLHLLRSVQMKQDRGLSWAVAVQQALDLRLAFV